MVRALALLIVAAVAAASAPGARAGAPPTAQMLYEQAFALEHVLRGDLAAEDGSPALARRLRDIIVAYEGVVRRYPQSGYCDNALWQAAGLASEAVRRWSQDRDRSAERRLLKWLVSEYPNSSFIARAREQLAQAEARPAPPPKPDAVAAAGRPAGSPPAVREAPGPAEQAPASLISVRRTVLPDLVRVTIELDREVRHATDRIDGPPRVFFDFAPSRLSAGIVEGTQAFSDDIVRQIRIGARPQQTTRVVIDVSGVKRYSAYEMYNPYRLVVDCERAQPGQPAAAPGAGAASAADERPAVAPPAAPPLARLPAPPPPLMSASWGPMFLGLPGVPPGGAPPSGSPGAPAAAASPVPAAARPSVAAAPPPARPSDAAPAPARSPEPPAPPASNLGGGYSLARQLGLGVSRIAIDPGHGGHDPGAQGSGTSEAAIALDVALRLEKLLLQAGGNDVVLTRRSDTYVALEERTAIANRAQADLFLSIHVNAHRNRSVRGVETYFLNFASTPDAASVAARENATAGMNMGSLPEVVKAIALSSKVNESRDLAAMVQQAMVRRISGANRDVKDLGVKQAPFVVLIGAAMPSVLVEISFITNGQDVRLLRDGAYRQRIAAALADAVQRYQKTLKTGRPTQPQ